MAKKTKEPIMTFTGQVVSISDEVKTKNNENRTEYVTCIVEFTDGPAKGHKVFAQRTLGNNKRLPNLDESVILHRTIVTDAVTNKPINFFEIQLESLVISQDSLNDLLG